jgi:hypothetical protein
MEAMEITITTIIVEITMDSTIAIQVVATATTIRATMNTIRAVMTSIVARLQGIPITITM